MKPHGRGTKILPTIQSGLSTSNSVIDHEQGCYSLLIKSEANFKLNECCHAIILSCHVMHARVKRNDIILISCSGLLVGGSFIGKALLAINVTV